MKFGRLIYLLLIVLSSCSVKEPKEEDMTKQEALRMSAQIDSSIRYKLPYYFNSLIDENAFGSKIAAVSGGKVSKEMTDGVKDALSRSNMGEKIISAIRNNGFYELVKYYEKDKKHHLIFRLYSEDGLNYHDFELTKRNGKVKIADMYIYLSGENLSKTLANLLSSLSGIQGEHASEQYVQINSLKKFKDLLAQNETEEALKYYNDLSDDMRKQKAIRLMYVLLCSKLDDEKYTNAINEYMALYPNEPNMYLMMVDSYILKKEYEKAIDAIDHVDKIINTDPFLDYMRALIYNLMEKPEESVKCLEKVHQNLPDFDDGALELIAHYIDSGQNEKAKQLIGEYKKNDQYDQSALRSYLYIHPEFEITE